MQLHNNAMVTVFQILRNNSSKKNIELTKTQVNEQWKIMVAQELVSAEGLKLNYNSQKSWMFYYFNYQYLQKSESKSPFLKCFQIIAT